MVRTNDPSQLFPQKDCSRMMGLLICAIILLSFANGGHAVDETSVFSRSALIVRTNAIGRTLHLTMAAATGKIAGERSLQLADDGLQTVCTLVQQTFQHNVTCNCVGNIADSFSISCQYAEPICSGSDTGKTCGKPQIAISMVHGKIFSATTCVSQYTRGTLALQDTCVFVDACPDSAHFCDCTASYGGAICDQCHVCEGGQALTVDCSNVNAEAISTQCSAVDLDLQLSGGAGSIAGFAPVFAGFCSELENALKNTISCDCTTGSVLMPSRTNAVGGTFSLTCHTNEPVCLYEHLCGTVETTVAVVNGKFESVTACATYDAPFGETCTALQLCDDNGKICGCVANYNGQMCQSCSVCENGASIMIDCSNVYVHAVTEQCQNVTAATSYEFLPNYSLPAGKSVVGQTNSGLSFSTQSSACGAIVLGTVAVFTVLAVALSGML